MTSENHNMEATNVHFQNFCGECVRAEELIINTKNTSSELMDKGCSMGMVLVFGFVSL